MKREAVRGRVRRIRRSPGGRCGVLEVIVVAVLLSGSRVRQFCWALQVVGHIIL